MSLPEKKGFYKVLLIACLTVGSLSIFMMSSKSIMSKQDMNSNSTFSNIRPSIREGRILENGMLEIQVPIAEGPCEPNWKSLGDNAVRPAWWKKAKIGMWLHWGPQSVGREGDWYAKWIYMPRHAWKKYEGVYQNHLEKYGHPSKHGYKDILPLWKAERWDPDELMRLYRRAGARYVLAQAMHHDNFDLWDSAHQVHSRQSRFGALDHRPGSAQGVGG